MVSVLKTFTKILCVNECDFMQVVDFLKGINLIPRIPNQDVTKCSQELTQLLLALALANTTKCFLLLEGVIIFHDTTETTV